MSDPDGETGQTIVEADREQTIRAIANGYGGATTMRPPCRGITTQMQFSTISFVERPADCSRHRLVWGHTIGREVARSLLGRDLDLRIRRDKLVWDGNALYDLHALTNERVVFHITHRNEPIDSLQAKPMDHVRHKLLEPDVLDSGHAFRALKIGRRGVATLLALARIVNKELRDLAKRAAFLAVIDDHAKPARLRCSRTFFDPVDEIRSTGTDVGAEDVRPVAFVMHTAGDLCARVVQFFDIAKEITVIPPIGGKKTCISGRVTNSGNIPAVCSNRMRRRLVSIVPKRSAMPGRCHTGSMAILTTEMPPF